MDKFNVGMLCVVDNYEGNRGHEYAGMLVKLEQTSGNRDERYGVGWTCRRLRHPNGKLISSYRGDIQFYTSELRPHCMFHGGERT